jgi:hypothetical protein
MIQMPSDGLLHWTNIKLQDDDANPIPLALTAAPIESACQLSTHIDNAGATVAFSWSTSDNSAASASF